MKVRTDNASGHVLDWLVAKCEGIAYVPEYQPSTKYDHGAEIMERKRISTSVWGDERWSADIRNKLGKLLHCSYGETFLIAAMRCYVKSNLGDEVEVPNELIGGAA